MAAAALLAVWGSCRPAWRLPRGRRRWGGAALAAAAAGFLQAGAVIAQGSGYSLPIVLEGVEGEANAIAINNLGHIAGQVWQPSYQGFLWTAQAGSVLLAPLPGDTLVSIEGINDNGWIVGTSYSLGGGPYQAVMFEPGQSAVPLFVGENSTTAVGINNSNWIVGQFVSSPAGPIQIFRFTPNGTSFLSLPPGGEWGWPAEINNAGFVAGTVYSPDAHAYVWASSGVPLSLGSLGGESRAGGINSSGLVVGAAEIGSTGSNIYHVFLSHPFFGMSDLGVPSPRDSFHAISDLGRVVGTVPAESTRTGVARAFTWYHGKFRYLPSLTPNGETEAWDVNTCGTIVGSARDKNGVRRAVRWIRRQCDKAPVRTNL